MNLAISKDTSRTLQANSNQITNPSLLFDKFLITADHGSHSSDQKDEALSRLTNVNPDPGYSAKSQHIVKMARETQGERFHVVYGRLSSRLAINLANGLLDNAGIALDRNFGSPYIPASAVKGCCRHAAFWMEREGDIHQSEIDAIFGSSSGDEGTRGGITFLPAFPIQDLHISLDILTPHPRDESGTESNPIPNKYPTVETGALFAFVYWLNPTFVRNSSQKCSEVHDRMDRILENAFSNGFGAKTAAGHGWFHRDREFEKELAKVEEEERNKQQIEEKKQRFELEKRRIEEEKKKKKIEEQKQQEANRLEREKERKRQEAERKKFLKSASEESKLELQLSEMGKKEFVKFLRGLSNKEEWEQKIALKTLNSKNLKKQKQLIKESGAKDQIQALQRKFHLD